MGFRKKLKLKIWNYFQPESPKIPFFTKDVFAGKKFSIGEYTYGNPAVLFENDDANLTIGKFCSIADEVTIFLGGNHRTDWITTYPFNALKSQFPEAANIKGHPATKGDVTIGNDVWLARGCTIMSGVAIGNGAVIGTASVVAKNVGDYEIWAGNPAKFVRKRFDDETIAKLLQAQWCHWDIEKIKRELPNLCDSNPDYINKMKP
jgi:acetyltransferase-like isoleucine patch superfamily enzyme